MLNRLLCLGAMLLLLAGCSDDSTSKQADSQSGNTASMDTNSPDFIEKWNSYVAVANHDIHEAIGSYLGQFGDQEEMTIPDAPNTGSFIASFPDTQSNLDAALKAASKGPNLAADAVVKELVPAKKAVIATIEQIAEYYKAKNYVDDSYAKGKELHKQFLEQLAKYMPLEKEFQKALAAMESSMRHDNIKQMREAGFVKLPTLLEVIDAGQALQGELDRQGIDYTNIHTLDMEAYRPFYTQLTAAVEKLQTVVKDEKNANEKGNFDADLETAIKLKAGAAALMELAQKGPDERLNDKLMYVSLGRTAFSTEGTPEYIAAQISTLVDRFNTKL